MLVSENQYHEAGIRTITVAAQRRSFTGLSPTKPGYVSRIIASF